MTPVGITPEPEGERSTYSAVTTCGIGYFTCFTKEVQAPMDTSVQVFGRLNPFTGASLFWRFSEALSEESHRFWDCACACLNFGGFKSSSVAHREEEKTFYVYRFSI